MACTLADLRPSREVLERHIQLACLLEVSAPKPGNITPGHDFSDTTYVDMVRSALVLAPVLARRSAGEHGVGALIAAGVRATARVTRANTNLGIVLLFAPLVCAVRIRRDGEALRSAAERVLAGLDVDDAAAAFAAIARARPGGLGDAPEHDVRAPARVTLREAMAAAAHRDSIASEYATGYAIVFDTGLRLLTGALRGGGRTVDAVVALHVGLLAAYPDTLIERKAGAGVAREVTAAAREVVAGRLSLAQLDGLLRADGHRLNPGTSADLVAATLLVAMLSGVRLP